MEEKNRLIEIDYATLLLKLWKHKFLILLIGSIFGVGMFAYNLWITTPTYLSTTKIYAVNKRTENQTLTYQDLQLGSHLVKDYEQIIRSREVMSKVIEELNLSMSTDVLARRIRVGSPKDTRVIEITVANSNPQNAAILANAVRDASIDKIKEITKIEDLTVIEEATTPSKAASPNKKKNALYAFVAGMILSSGLIVIKEILDDHVKRPEDVEVGLDMVLLGSIPNIGKGRR